MEHYRAWNRLFAAKPELSRFVRKMILENSRWERMIEEYQPAQGIRGFGLKRREKYIRRDDDLLALYTQARDNPNPVDPLNYLRRIASNL